uniref:FAD-binding FR-type domain-containing protein n=1 Tax=Leersia perrieri TaxID=77586 RepID=A0A0D9VFC7_9ORYZ
MAAAAATISTALHLRPSPPPHASPLPAMGSLPFLRRRQMRSRRVAAVKQDAAVWTPAPVASFGPATADGSLVHFSVDLSDATDLAASYTAPGQYLLIRVPGEDDLKPAFMAIASPPGGAAGFEFLVKTVPGTTAEKLCGLRDGDVVELGAIMGNGFPISRINPPDEAQTVLLFATGTGISPIRSLIEFGFDADQRADVRLYYGARNLQTMAYQDKFTNWESTGLKVIPVLSRADDSWQGERGYVQDAFLKAQNISNHFCTGAVLCGQKQMSEVCLFSLFPILLHIILFCVLQS